MARIDMLHHRDHSGGGTGDQQRATRLISRVRTLMGINEPDQLRQAVELVCALGEPAVFTDLLSGCRAPDGVLQGNSLFSAGDSQSGPDPLVLELLLTLILHAPPTAQIHDELRRDRLSALRLLCAGQAPLPPGMSRLTALRHLSLAGSMLSSLPETLAELTQLRSLDLRHNRLVRFPAVLLELSELTELRMDFNALESLPADIHRLRGLKTLSLIGNPLVRLPDGLASLDNLEQLDLSRTSMRTLPPVLARLPRLSTLRLRSTRMRPSPEQLARFPALKHLEVNRGAFRDVRAARDRYLEVCPGLTINL